MVPPGVPKESVGVFSAIVFFFCLIVSFCASGLAVVALLCRLVRPLGGRGRGKASRAEASFLKETPDLTPPCPFGGARGDFYLLRGDVYSSDGRKPPPLIISKTLNAYEDL